MVETAPEKVKVFDEWMDGDHMMVHLDSRREGVEVPESCRNNPGLTLKLSYLFQGETTRDELGITVFLKFSGQYQRCFLPWSSIWGFTSEAGEQKVWAGDMPAEFVIQLAVQKLKEVGKNVIRGGAGQKKSEAKRSEEPAPKKKRGKKKSAEVDPPPPAPSPKAPTLTPLPSPGGDPTPMHRIRHLKRIK